MANEFIKVFEYFFNNPYVIGSLVVAGIFFVVVLVISIVMFVKTLKHINK